MVSISRSIFPASGMMNIEQPMMHIRLYREGGRYVESADRKKGKRKKKEEEEKEKKKKRENTYTITDEQPSTLGVPDFKKGLGLQESIEVITKHSIEGIHRWPLWLQDGHGWLLRLLLRRPCLHPTLSADSRHSTLQALSSAGWSSPLLPAWSWL
jgi:hypothetical protein